MKVLVLVLSHLEDGYEPFIDLQKETWDSIPVPGVETFFYYGGKTRTGKPNEWGIDCDSSIENSYNKMILAFKKALEFNWDYIFKTNSTSYVVKSELIKMHTELPALNTISGQLGHYPYCFKKTGHVQGFSMMISRDIVQKLVSDYSEAPGMDAKVISRILFDKETVNMDISYYPVGVESVESIDPKEPAYLYRVNKNTDLKSRYLLLEQIHKTLTQTSL